MKKQFDRSALEDPVVGARGMHDYVHEARQLDLQGKTREARTVIADGLKAYPQSPQLMFARASNLHASGASSEMVMLAYQAAYERSLHPQFSRQRDLDAPMAEFALFMRQNRPLGGKTMMATEGMLLNYQRTRDAWRPDVLIALGDLYAQLNQKPMAIACYGQATTLPDCPAGTTEKFLGSQATGFGYSAHVWEAIEGRVERSGRAEKQPALAPPPKPPSQG